MASRSLHLILRGIFLILSLGVTFFLYERTFIHLIQTWRVDPFYVHGPWVALCGLFLYLRILWIKREDPILTLENSHISFFFGLLLLSLLIYVSALYTGVHFLEGVSFLFWGISLTTLFLSKRLLKDVAFPFVLFLCAVPLPYLGELSGLLQVWVSTICFHFFTAFGFPITQEGINLYFPHAAIQISADCTGLKSWLVLFSLVLFFIYFVRMRWGVKFGIVLSIIPIAFFSNLCRVIVILFLAYYKGQEVAMQVWHNYASLMFYLLSCVFILGMALWGFRYGKAK